MRGVRRVLVGAVVVAAATTLPTTAGAGMGELELELASPTAPLTFTATINGFSCNPNSFVLVDLQLDGAPIEPLSVTEDPSEPNRATIVLPSDAGPGTLSATASCTDGELTIPPQSDIQGFATLTVTKVVQGSAPPDATFTVNVDCIGQLEDATALDAVGPAALPEDFDVDLGFGASGGLGYVYTDHSVECTVTEPQTGGATSITIVPQAVVIDDPILFESTVTNTFPIVVEPTFTG